MKIQCKKTTALPATLAREKNPRSSRIILLRTFDSSCINNRIRQHLNHSQMNRN